MLTRKDYDLVVEALGKRYHVIKRDQDYAYLDGFQNAIEIIAKALARNDCRFGADSFVASVQDCVEENLDENKKAIAAGK